MTEAQEIQEWFAALISQPLQKGHALPEISPFGTLNSKESEKFVAASPTLCPYQRIEIYHQQYWWRLLKALKDNFPMLHRLFGDDSFDEQIAIPYLSRHLPSHWALCKLGENLPEWLEQNYREKDYDLVTTSALIDRCALHAFSAPCFALPPYALLSQEELLVAPLILQPHLHLFALQADFFSFREEFLQKDSEYYNVYPFPKMNYGEHYFVLYRTTHGVVSWKQVTRAEFWLLSRFESGNIIEQACAEMEKEGEEFCEEAFAEIPFWFKQWTVMEWLGQF